MTNYLSFQNKNKKTLGGNGLHYFRAEKKFVSSPSIIGKKKKKSKLDPFFKTDSSGKHCPSFLKFLSSAFCKWELHAGKDPDCSQTLVTVVSPDLPACCVCLGMWPGETFIMRVAYEGFFSLSCCMWCSLCESTYVQDHWFPAHSAPCSCRMGIFVKRWSSFYACHWMTVKEKRHGAKQGTSNCCHTHADKTTSL